jgi:hypothetical protein
MHSEPVLLLFQPGFETRLQTEISCVDVGASLSQIHPEGIERPVAFVSRTLTPAEQKWTTTEQELLASVYALKKLRQFLDAHPVKIFSDRHAL